MALTDQARAERVKHAEAAAERYRMTSDERHTIERERDAGVAFPDSPEAIAARAARLLDRHEVPAAAMVERIREEPLPAPLAYERILGVSKELQAASFLPRGARAARTVARLSAREGGRELPLGTGFLISPRLLMTNHHVLPDQATARRCFAEFDAQVTIDNTPGVAVRLELGPELFFVADEHLDFALVLILSGDDGQPPGEVFGWNRLIVQKGKLVIGEPVNVIGHPSGRLKEIAVRDNALQVRLDDFLHYRTDTEPGNSGSPVFNDQWEVVALHHSGVPNKDAQGRTLRKDGRIWQPSDGDDAVDWVSNEGVRISSILKYLRSLSLDATRRGLLAEMGADSGLTETAAALRQAGQPPAGSVPAVTLPGAAPVAATAGRTGEAASAPVGAKATTSAFGSGRHLVFLHGRNQQCRNAEDLRRDWAAWLNQGLTRAGSPPIAPSDAWFPYYGNLLVQAMRPHEATTAYSLEEAMTTSAAEACAPTGAARDTYEKLITEAAEREGMPPETQLASEGFPWGTVVGGLQRQLSWLAAKTDIDQWAIAAVFRDVAAYLDDPGVRDTVLDGVLASMPTSGELVLVTHSLGTVVGMDVITRLAPELNVALLVTAGSPLGMDAVYRRLLIGGPQRPEQLVHWLNAWCPTDAIAIGCPLTDAWKGELTDIAVPNSRARAHHMAEYLAHQEVAHTIGHALRAS